jgi:hypothetical protein
VIEEEIIQAARQVKTDAYQMSIGEIINMYRDGDLIINPDFQRLFRWDIVQKSRLIESILLGIPLPSIFVFERDDSKWELVDGLQRVSTILEFMGELQDPDENKKKPPTALVGTKYLPSLDNAVWEKSKLIPDIKMEEQTDIGSTPRTAIKRSRIGVEILKRPSENATKYDLFQRLNSGGTAANPQELRNCIAIMIDRRYAKFLKDLSDFPPYRAVLAASNEQIEKQRHMEYVSRFLVYTYIQYNGKLDVEEYIDDGMVQLATRNETKRAGKVFKDTFTFLRDAFGGDALRRIQDNSHTGRVGLAAFECIAVGIAKNIDFIRSQEDPAEHIKQRTIKLWKQAKIDDFFTPGLRGTVRIQRTIDFGKKWYSK